VKPQPVDTSRDADLRKATAALVRAGVRARQLASQTQTAVITWKDGKVVRTYPQLEPRSRVG
jgi:hypothetical protein